MKIPQTITETIDDINEENLEQPIVFEERIVQRISFTAKTKEVILKLINDIKSLKEEVNKLKKEKLMLVEEVLAKDWDNEYDEAWDKC